jgi:hypothetical protein
MWLPNSVVTDVDRVARITYINVDDCKAWNEHRRDGELRMLTGWLWVERSGARYRQGFKTQTICYRDAWYELVAETVAPVAGRPRLRVVSAERRSA